jgi:amino acid adenylation domain-containing protein
MSDALSFLVASNQTTRAWADPTSSIPERIAQQAERQPDVVALTFEGEHLTYAQLNLQANVLAALLRQRGVQRGDLVGLMLERSFELVIALVAVLKAGAAYVPLDLSLPEERLRGMLDDCQPKLLLHENHPRLIGLMAGRQGMVIDFEQLADRPAPVQALPEAPQASDLIYAIYTSGSTGMPKAALNEHGGVLNRLLWLQETHPLQAGDAVLQKTPSSFDVSVWEFFWPLIVGARLVLARPGGHLDPSYLADLMAHERVTVAHFVPTMLRVFLDAMGKYLPTSVRLLFFSGEALPIELAQRVMTQWPSAQAWNYYGPTECAVDVSHWDCRQLPVSGRVLIGNPLANTRLYILDEQLQPVAPGTEGELFIAGVQVGRGYLNRPALSAEKFLPDPFAHLFDSPAESRMYRTGDVARLHLGQGIEYLGRTDFQVKVNGLRIELGDIEAAIMATGQASLAVAMAQSHGLDGQRLIAAVVPIEGPTDSVALLRSLKDVLPAYMVPSAIFYVSSLPTTSSGKTDRNALLRRTESEAGGRSWPCVPDLLQRMVQLHPDRIALETQGGESLTYRDIDQRSAHLARGLQARGVRAGDRVALMMDRSADVVLAMVAVTRIGAVYAPIDTKAPQMRQRLILETLRPVLTISALDEFSSRAPLPDQEFQQEWDSPAAQSALCVMFTSGSTGAPKGVLVPHEGVARLVHGGCCDHLSANARWAWLSSPAFDASHLEIWGPLLNGGTCVLPRAALPSIDEICEFLSTQSLDSAWLTAALFNALVDHDVRALRGLKQLLIGGERLSQEHVRLALSACPSLTLINGYGPTEGTTFALTHRITEADCDNSQGIPIGVPIRATATRIDDIDPITGLGELIIGGPGVALGYLGLSTQGPASPFFTEGRQRWYHSGDLVKLDEYGRYAYGGRKDHQVKIQGHRIDIDEVERHLLNCPAVSEAVVVSVGELADQKYLAAAIKRQVGAKPQFDAIQNQLRLSLPEAVVPRILVELAQMPLSLNGKIDRAAVSKQVAQHLHQPNPKARDQWPTPTMAALAELWASHLPAAPQDPEAGFLACGGTSMGALVLAAAIRKRLGRSVAPGDLLLKGTLRDHAALVEAAPVPRVREASSQTEEYLTEQQKTLLIASHLDPSGAAMLVHVPLLIDAGLEKPRLKRAFASLWQRHPMLRVAATLEDGEVRSTLLGTVTDGWWSEQGDLDVTPGDMQWPLDLLTRIERRLDTSEGPVRVDVWDAPGGQTLVVWTVHHYAIDEASTDTCLSELDAMLRGETLEPVRGSPFAFASFEQQWLDLPGIEALAKTLIGDWEKVKPPFVANMAQGRQLVFSLPAPLQDALRQCCARLSCTPFPLLLAAYGAAVQDTFGDAFARVLTPFSRRLEPELLDPVNYFLDVRLMEAGVRKGESPQTHLSRVYKDILESTSPTFQPLARISELVSRKSASSANILGSFALTWRQGSARSLSMGNTQARLLRCPQHTTKFGVSMHAALVDGHVSLGIEAVEEAFEGGNIHRLFDAFMLRLHELAHVSSIKRPTRAPLEQMPAAMHMPEADRTWPSSIAPAAPPPRTCRLRRNSVACNLAAMDNGWKQCFQ